MSFMSTRHPFCDSDCPSVVMSPRHVACPSVFAFSYVPDNICHTTLFANPVCTLSVLQGDSYHDSLHLPLGCDQFFKLGATVWQPYVITGSTHSLNAFHFSLTGTFLSCMMLSSLQNAFHPCPILIFISFTWSWSLVIICPRYMYLCNLLDLLSIDNHIILVDMLVTHFPRCILRPTGLLMSWLEHLP